MCRPSDSAASGCSVPRFTMQGSSYPAVFSKSGIDLVVPAPGDLTDVQDIYVTELLKRIERLQPSTRGAIMGAPRLKRSR